MARLDSNKIDQVIDFFDRLGGFENDDEKALARDAAIDIEVIEAEWDEFCEAEFRDIENGNHNNIWEVM